MRREEVEAVLGGPAGLYFTRTDLRLFPPTRRLGTYPYANHEQTWLGDQGRIKVYFTEEGTVGSADFCPAERVSLAERVRAGLRRLWP